MQQGTMGKFASRMGGKRGALTSAARAMQLYTTLLQANKAIQRAASVQDLFEVTCRLCTEFGSFDLAWIGRPAPGHLQMQVVAVHGPLQAYGEGPVISLEPGPSLATGLTGRCFLEGSPKICNDCDAAALTSPWRDWARTFGIRSSAAVPIHHRGQVLATLTLYSRRVAFFQPDRMELLEELGQDLTFALERLDREEELRQMNAGLEARVLERTRQLEEANHELTSFAHSISHDLRAPLRHLTGFSDLLAAQLGSAADPKAAHYLGVIRAAAQRMNKLIDALLAYARMGREEIRPVPLDLNGILGRVLEEQQADLAGRDIRWVLGPLPSIQGDPNLVFLLLHNLVGNAVKFTRKLPQAVIEFQPLDNPPGFLIRDNGAGFDQTQVDRLFGLFQRLHAEKDFPGTGLGLANAQRIVRRHGGRIWAEGEPGRGATFYVTFPLKGATSGA
jgi:signal transduction histidine kinase